MASKRYNCRDDQKTGVLKKPQDSLLDINPEGELLREIKDIMDELFIMTLIKIQEENVARTFVKYVRKTLRRNWSAGGDSSSIDNRSETSLPELAGSRLKRPSQSQSLRRRPIVLDQQGDSEDVVLTMTAAEELLESIQDQRMELRYLSDAAEHTSLAASTYRFSTSE